VALPVAPAIAMPKAAEMTTEMTVPQTIAMPTSFIFLFSVSTISGTTESPPNEKNTTPYGTNHFDA